MESKKLFTLLCTVVTFLLFSCVTKVEIGDMSAKDVYSPSNKKIAGKYLLFIDENGLLGERNMKPTTQNGKINTFIFSPKTSVISSIATTTKNIFDSVEYLEKNINTSSISNNDLNGIIYIKIVKLHAEITFLGGGMYSSGDSLGSTDVSMGVTIKNSRGEIILSKVFRSQREKHIDPGVYGEGGAKALSSALSLAFQDVLEQYSEEIFNSQKIKSEFGETDN